MKRRASNSNLYRLKIILKIQIRAIITKEFPENFELVEKWMHVDI